jgi:putative copper export protein
MLADVISALVRALSFIALFQAAGIAIFVAIFGRRLDGSSAAIRHVGAASAMAGIMLVSIHYALEAARMAGALSGTVDMSLQRLVFASSTSVAWGLRVAGLLAIVASINRRGRVWARFGIAGAVLTIAGFLFVGHTAVHPDRGSLAIVLSVHLAIIAFWFGALVPLIVVGRKEKALTAAQIVDDFSRVATWWVPGILLAGAILTWILVDRWAVFDESYGMLVLAKVFAFALLMFLAALNKWRYAPTLATKPGAAIGFQRAVATEYLLICLVLSITAVMTTFFSPEQ